MLPTSARAADAVAGPLRRELAVNAPTLFYIPIAKHRPRVVAMGLPTPTADLQTRAKRREEYVAAKKLQK